MTKAYALLKLNTHIPQPWIERLVIKALDGEEVTLESGELHVTTLCMIGDDFIDARRAVIAEIRSNPLYQGLRFLLENYIQDCERDPSLIYEMPNA